MSWSRIWHSGMLNEPSGTNGKFRFSSPSVWSEMSLGPGPLFPLNIKWSTWDGFSSIINISKVCVDSSSKVKRSEGHVGLACIVRVERSVGSFLSYLSSHSLYSVNDSHTNHPTTHLPSFREFALVRSEW